jgi:hypothetical protein
MQRAGRTLLRPDGARTLIVRTRKQASRARMRRGPRMGGMVLSRAASPSSNGLQKAFAMEAHHGFVGLRMIVRRSSLLRGLPESSNISAALLAEDRHPSPHHHFTDPPIPLWSGTARTHAPCNAGQQLLEGKLAFVGCGICHHKERFSCAKDPAARRTGSSNLILDQKFSLIDVWSLLRRPRARSVHGRVVTRTREAA